MAVDVVMIMCAYFLPSSVVQVLREDIVRSLEIVCVDMALQENTVVGPHHLPHHLPPPIHAPLSLHYRRQPL